MKPSSFNCALRANKTASQRKVTRVSPCLAMSLSVSTPVTNSAPNPRKATAVPLRPSALPKTQPPALFAVGLGARSLGDGEHDREEHAAPRRVARERRRDERVGEHQAVG